MPATASSPSASSLRCPPTSGARPRAARTRGGPCSCSAAVASSGVPASLGWRRAASAPRRAPSCKQPARAGSAAAAAASGAPPPAPDADDDALDDDVWASAFAELEDGGDGGAAAPAPFATLQLQGKERVYLLGFELKRERGRAAFTLEESLDELARLADSAGLEVVGRDQQRLEIADPRTLVGSGKVEEVIAACGALGAETLIFDCELSPRQGRNIEELAAGRVRVCDRTALILDIFAQRAATREGKLQVALAQAEYQLPRLTRMWTHLDRVGGGGQVKGAGERQIELDRRQLRDRMSTLRQRLEGVRKHREQYRSRRREEGVPVLALAGYTNAGKSTLLNLIAGADVLAEDRLFATLDPTTRRVRLPGGKEALMTDTVGFIDKLPTELVAAFRATLEEVAEAALILHVVDASQPNRDGQISAVERVLGDLGVLDVPSILVLNKLDAAADADALRARAAASGGAAVCVSAHTGEGIEQLLTLVADQLSLGLCAVELAVAHAESGAVLAEVRAGGGVVEHERWTEDAVLARARVPLPLARRLHRYRQAAAERSEAEAEPAAGPR